MAIVRNKRLRKLVFERDEGICCDCGRYDPKWQHDHDVPLWQGGKDSLENSKTRCRHCHMQKTVSEAPVRAKSDRIAERHALMQRRRRIG